MKEREREREREKEKKRKGRETKTQRKGFRSSSSSSSSLQLLLLLLSVDDKYTHTRARTHTHTDIYILDLWSDTFGTDKFLLHICQQITENFNITIQTLIKFLQSCHRVRWRIICRYRYTDMSVRYNAHLCQALGVHPSIIIVVMPLQERKKSRDLKRCLMNVIIMHC